jgi:light-regulated signal transduction histidine kinase (bacteriophytochrome)
LNLSELSARVIESLAQTHPQRNVDVVIAPAMTIEGDRGLMHIAMENLLSNAWKFTSRAEQARIEVGCTTHDGTMVYFVRDNGVGFDMKYAAKLFGAFQRLHSAEAFEGTGIGLNIVQRIIVRHAGRVWAEAAVEKGATFYFTLGNNEQSADTAPTG